jgi:DNA-binding transcriptional LysR family regulator
MALPYLARVDLNLLHTFLVVADQSGVGRAAKLLGRTQPAITSRLRQLERMLGVELFQRVGRHLGLSPAGRAIEPELREALKGLQGALERVRASGSEPAGLIRIGTLPTVSNYILAPLLTRLVARYPAMEIDVRLDLTRPQLQQLISGDLDVVFSIGPPPSDPRLQVEALGEIRAVAVVSQKERGLPRGPLTIERLAALGIVAYGSVGDFFFDAVWAFIERKGLARGIRLRVAHIQTLKTIVADGGAVTILPDYTVVERDLVKRPVAGLDVSQSLWMASRRDAQNLPALAALRKGLPRLKARRQG